MEPRRPSLGVHGTKPGVGLLQPEAGADHRVLACVVPELDVGRGDDRAVGEKFHTWIAAVAPREAVSKQGTPGLHAIQ